MASLYQMRDLVMKMIELPSSGVNVGLAYGPAVEKSLEYILSAGMEACLNAAIQKVVTIRDLRIAMEIFQLVLPREQDKPKQCLALIEVFPSEFDCFDEDLANFDLDGVIAGRQSAPAPVWTVNDCRVKAIQLITNNLRVVVQQLVLNYPQTEAPAFDELYAIDLLGMIISTCEVQFFWDNFTSPSVKPRNLAPRVLSAALKYNREKEWFGNGFLREKGSDCDLASSWLLGTLDASALNPFPMAYKAEDAPFSIRINTPLLVTSNENSCMRDSDSWVMLTDGIIYHLLRKDPVGICTMDPQIFKLLHEVASSCKFRTAVRANKDGLHDIGTLYDLHLDVFQSFCKSAGDMWRSYNQWHQRNQFRGKMMNPPGVFTSFLE
ncbi:unnamed protein product [Phytophthora fragariaefolia]|uniref:Unnamed protein product n=1 Tax=Phytophthora fragariaefolia TaxID=1490495 RepID=A0A9W7CZ64_9STRA|nr:unnamed protein product [Phytophthora fragariaefolia]